MSVRVALCLLAMVVWFWPPSVRTTTWGGMRAELEMSTLCYARYDPNLWNFVIAHLPAPLVDQVETSVDTMAALVARLTAALRAQLPACRAAVRAMHIKGESTKREVETLCKALLQPLSQAQRAALLRCLGGAVSYNTMTKSRTAAEEAAEAINLRALSMMAVESGAPEVSLTFPGQYSDGYTQTIVAALQLALSGNSANNQANNATTGRRR